MERFDRSHLPQLLAEDGELRVSCHLPMVRAGRETRQNSIRFKNMLRDAEQALEARGVAKRDAAALLGPLEAAMTGERFWERQLEGLAAYAAPNRALLFACDHSFEPSVTVAPRFSVVPMLPLINADRRFVVLALSRHAVRVIAASRQRHDELEIGPSVPRRLTDVVGTQLERESLQQHSEGPATIFHGQGSGEDDRLPELESYCRAVDAALAKELAEAHPELAGLPIVLAGDVQVTATFRRLARHLSVLEQGVDGNHDRTPAMELRDQAWPIIAARLEEEERELVEQYHERHAAGRASDDPGDVLAAARGGRVETLLVRRDGYSGEPGSEPSANPAVIATLTSSGTARELEVERMPTEAPCAAIYRY